MLNSIWSAILLIGIIIAAFTGNLEAVSSGILTSTQDAIDLLIVMCGMIAMWNGFLTIAEGSGLIRQLTHYMRPLLRILFP